MAEHYTNLFFSISLHVLLLFLFLTIFYWTIITKTEKRSLDIEINNSIDSLNIKIPKNSVTEDVFKYFKSYYSGKNSNLSKNNNLLLKFNIVIIILIFVVLISILSVRYFTCNLPISISEILLENIIILILVGGIEYYFFMNIASKYVPVLPSYLPSIVKENIDYDLKTN